MRFLNCYPDLLFQTKEEQKMKIMLIGATGRSGQEVMKQALEVGYEIVAYVRRPEAIEKKKNVTVVGGQLDNLELMIQTAKDCDAIIVTLGPKISDRNSNLMELAIPNVIAVAKAAQVSRVIVLSALGVGETYKNTQFPYRLGAKTFLRGNFKDHQSGEIQLATSGLNWTTIHPGPLFDGEKTSNPIIEDAASGFKMPGAPRTFRGDVAYAILKILSDSETYGKQILVTSTHPKNGK